MTALQAALTILWQGMLGIFAVMALITLIVIFNTRISMHCWRISSKRAKSMILFLFRLGM